MSKKLFSNAEAQRRGDFVLNTESTNETEIKGEADLFEPFGARIAPAPDKSDTSVSLIMICEGRPLRRSVLAALKFVEFVLMY